MIQQSYSTGGEVIHDKMILPDYWYGINRIVGHGIQDFDTELKELFELLPTEMVSICILYEK